MDYRVAHLTSAHYAFDTRIFHRECRSLVLAGYDVTLIAQRAEGDVEVDGIKIVALKPPTNRLERMTGTVWSLYRTALRVDADLYHFHDPELLPVGVLLKLLGKKVVYDVHEDYSGTMEGKQWLPSFLYGPAVFAVTWCERLLGRVCDRYVAATPTIAAKFPSGRTRLVQNYPWLHELYRADAAPYDERELIGTYVGWLGDYSGVDAMKQAFEIAAKELPVKLLVGGKVIAGAKAEFVKNSASDVVEYLGFVTRPQIAELFARSRMGLVTVLPSGNSINAQPTKMFEYMSCGLPVLASDFPVYRKFVESAGCGFLVDPTDPASIAEKILWLIRNPQQAKQMGENGRRAVVDRYNWEREARSLVATYEELLPVRGAQPNSTPPVAPERTR